MTKNLYYLDETGNTGNIKAPKETFNFKDEKYFSLGALNINEDKYKLLKMRFVV